MRAFQYARARTPAEAVGQHRASGTEYLAGGTTLLDLVKLDVMRPEAVVDINRLDLAKIETLPDGRTKIGALVRNSDLAHDRGIREKFPVLAEALLNGASAQLRNMATTSGNLMQRTRCPYFRDGFSACNKRAPGSGCAALEGFNRSHAILGGSEACIATHPSDMCVALAALDAEILVQGSQGDGAGRVIPITKFHLLPGRTPEKEFALERDELITAVVLPALQPGTRSWYLKIRDRESFEFALASAAVVLETQGSTISSARIALGGVATKPWRATEAEAALRGAPLEESAFANAAALAVKGASPREHNAFKIELAKRVVTRALSAVAASQPTVREI
ncbi:MAG TPA: xanthine dehydrogenase family protein subunit M [Opitutaceae bacterium]|nr:xanthine dehydrogenase family protein subunit M [Opitutaceae bacterium]